MKFRNGYETTSHLGTWYPFVYSCHSGRPSLRVDFNSATHSLSALLFQTASTALFIGIPFQVDARPSGCVGPSVIIIGIIRLWALARPVISFSRVSASVHNTSDKLIQINWQIHRINVDRGRQGGEGAVAIPAQQ